MKVRILVKCIRVGKAFRYKNDIVKVADSEARRLVEAGDAEYPDRQVKSPPADKMMRPAPAKRREEAAICRRPFRRLEGPASLGRHSNT